MDAPAIRKKEKLTFRVITAAIGLPLILAAGLVALDMRADLSELKPNRKVDDTGTVIVAWRDLKESSAFARPVRMIGYMLDDPVRHYDENRANIFILQPEAGQFLHPAHRIPDQAVVVWPRHPVVFHNRELVWASGTLQRTPRTSGGDQPEYALTFADVSPADERDIGRWFHP